MNIPEVARRYAVALMEAAVEAGVLDRVQQDVEGLLATVSQSVELVAFWGDRLHRAEVQENAIRELFADRVEGLTLNFLVLMAQRRRVHLIPQVLDCFVAMGEERAGVVRGQVRSAVELNAEQVERLSARLAAYTGKEVRLEVQVDESLRGGLVARIGDTVFDGSLDAQLERLRQRLVGT